MDEVGLLASNFLELASEQRLKILVALSSKQYRTTELAKKWNVTPQEVHRNLERLSNAGFVKKTNEHFDITSIGKILITQMPLMKVLSNNKKIFETHNVEKLPIKFVRRIGALEKCTHVKGVTKVISTWEKICKNSTDMLCDIVSEVPISMDKIIVKRVQKGCKYRHIISNNIDEPDGRNQILNEIGYYSLIKNEKILRKKFESNGIILILNEKEAGIIFPTNDGEPDLRHMFYGNDETFQDWCLDLFEFYWKKAKKYNRVTPK